MSQRQQTVEHLAAFILQQRISHPLRVAVDGVDGAGKTVLAGELAPLLAQSRPVIRASVDGFHNPRAVRYRQGADSPRGYYQDSFDNQAIIDFVLQPLGPNGNRIFRVAKFDHRADAPVDTPPLTAPEEAILLFDGVFLRRPELAAYWDCYIFVDVDFSITVPRAVQRDLLNGANGMEESLLARYQRRYVAGQQLYFRQAQPRQFADVIWDNTDFENPLCIYC